MFRWVARSGNSIFRASLSRLLGSSVVNRTFSTQPKPFCYQDLLEFEKPPYAGVEFRKLTGEPVEVWEL